jgi:hypothetical protein
MTNHRHRTAHCTRNTPIHRQSRHTARRYAHLRFCARVLRRNPNRPSLVDFLDVLVAFVAYFILFASLSPLLPAEWWVLPFYSPKEEKETTVNRQTNGQNRNASPFTFFGFRSWKFRQAVWYFPNATFTSRLIPTTIAHRSLHALLAVIANATVCALQPFARCSTLAHHMSRTGFPTATDSHFDMQSNTAPRHFFLCDAPQSRNQTG